MSDPIHPQHPAGARRGPAGFTLVELLVVLTIIVLMVAAAVPAVRFIVGSRSTEAATNVVSAYLGRARNDAVQLQQTRGVVFFLDPDTDLTTMALVSQNTDDLRQYAAWTDGKLEYRDTQTPANFQYLATGTTGGPSSAQAMLKKTATVAAAESGPFAASQWFLQPYVCGRTHTPAAWVPYSAPAGNHPPRAPFWRATGDRFIELADGTDFQTLPTGVGVQLINDPKLLPTATGYPDRYLRTSCILFDPTGKFVSVPWAVKGLNGGAYDSELGRKLQLRRDLDVLLGNGVPALYSAFGMVLYDREKFRTAIAAPSENDYIFTFPLNMMPAKMSSPTGTTDEQAKEAWLDDNTLPLMINRQNGTLIKGE